MCSRNGTLWYVRDSLLRVEGCPEKSPPSQAGHSLFASSPSVSGTEIQRVPDTPSLSYKARPHLERGRPQGSHFSAVAISACECQNFALSRGASTGRLTGRWQPRMRSRPGEEPSWTATQMRYPQRRRCARQRCRAGCSSTLPRDPVKSSFVPRAHLGSRTSSIFYRS